VLVMNRTFAKAIYYGTPEQYERLKDLAYKKKVSMSFLIRCALDQVYFDGGEEQEQ